MHTEKKEERELKILQTTGTEKVFQGLLFFLFIAKRKRGQNLEITGHIFLKKVSISSHSLMKPVDVLLQELPKVRATAGFKQGLDFCTAVKVVQGELLTC